MFKVWVSGVLLLLSSVSIAGSPIAILDNHDIALVLSQSNYNRLVVKNDKIVEAVFPSQSMNIKRDEQDGSIYVMLASSNSFTLFLTTESGLHFSVTVTGEEGLGKTVEMMAPHSKVLAQTTTSVPLTQPSEDPHQRSMIELIQHMEKKEPMAGMSISHPFGRVERMGAGLTLIPKEIWTGEGIIAERLEVINRGKTTLTLLPSFFEGKNVEALKLSQSILKSHETAMLYRVREVSHG